jgi:hypothetical protein
LNTSKLISLACSLQQFEVLDFEVDNIALLKPFCRFNWKKLQNPLPQTSFIPLYRNMKMSCTMKAERERERVKHKRDERTKEGCEREELPKEG